MEGVAGHPAEVKSDEFCLQGGRRRTCISGLAYREIEGSSKCGAVIACVRVEHDQVIGIRQAGCGELTGLDQSLLNHSFVFESIASKDRRASEWLGRSQVPSAFEKWGRS